MRSIAHRGCLAQYPENTLRAFRRSAEVVEMIETDVRRCGSGELVVFHDETLERVTDAVGEVASMPLSELKGVSILDTEEPVPLLSEAFEAVPSEVGFNLELKDDGIAAEAVEIADEYDHEVIVSSFRPGEVAAARDAGAESVALLFHSEDESADDFDVSAALDVAADLGCAHVHPNVRLCLETNAVAAAHARGFDVNAWTAKTEADVTALQEQGVDGIVIDDCGLAAVCGRNAE